jgi:hypothetical protein
MAGRCFRRLGFAALVPPLWFVAPQENLFCRA